MKPQQQVQHQHPFLHAHPSLEFAAAAPHHHHHHGYGTLPPGSLPPLAGLPGMQPAGRGPPTLLDRSHARMIPQALPHNLHPGSRTVDSSFLLTHGFSDPDPGWGHSIYAPSQISGSTDSGYAHSHHVYDPHGTGTGTPMIPPGIEIVVCLFFIMPTCLCKSVHVWAIVCRPVDWLLISVFPLSIALYP